MFKQFATMLVFCAAVVLSGCAGGPGQQPIGAELIETCASPRPEVCTREYRPVCAVMADKSRKQYANACEACADPQVTGFIIAGCPDN